MSPRFRLRQFLTTAGRLILVHAAFAAALAATDDFEMIPIAPLVTLFAVPSFVLYAILVAVRSARTHKPEGILLASLLPFSLYLGYCSFFAPEGRDLAMLMLGLYVLPAVLALMVELMFRVGECESSRRDDF